MTIELKVPEIGESITEVEVGDWLKNAGDAVGKDDPLVAIESQKATVELPAPAAGTLAQILKKKGEVASIGEVLGYLETGGQPQPSTTPAKEPPRAKPEIKPRAEVPTSQMPTTHHPHTEPAQPVRPAASLPLQESETPGAALPSAPQTAQVPGREEEVVPMSRLRRTVAERLVEAQNSAALLTTFNEVDMTGVMALRKEYGDAFQRKYGARLGIMSFFVKACVDALKQFPALNAEVRGTSIVYHNYYDIGIAVGSGKGLVVPVLRNAERMSFAQVELAIADFGRRAKENKLKLEELEGGTFTISNGGVYGSLLSTPLVNPPQSGVLGMHATQDRPVAREGNVVIRPMMYIALTYDHRLVDGREAVSALKRIRDIIETPARMLMEV